MRLVIILTAMESIQVYEVSHYTHSNVSYRGLGGRSPHSELWNLYRFSRRDATLTSVSIL